MLPYLVAFILALAGSLLVTPLVRRFALSRHLLAKPEERSVHAVPVPTLGGVALILAFFGAEAATCWMYSRQFPGLCTLLLGLSLGSLVIVTLGLYDDLKEASPLTKILFQVVGAYLLVKFGYSVAVLASPFGGAVTLGVWSVPFSVLWILVLVNALNLIDGLDGLAAGISVIIGISLLVTGIRLGNHVASLFMAGLIGASLGFLPYNFHPARIFMGDTGSLFIGFVFAAASVLGASKSAATVALLVPIVALGIPIIDTLTAIVRRTSRGHHFYRADKEHIHHKLLAFGFSHSQVVLILYGLSVVLGALAIALSTADRRIIFSFVAVAILICLAGASRLRAERNNRRRYNGPTTYSDNQNVR